MRKITILSLVIVIFIGLVACKAEKPAILLHPDGKAVQDKKVGEGAEAVKGKKLTVNYIGWHIKDEKQTKFADTYESGKPLTFTLGTDEVIEGWNKGLVGMKVGGLRWLGIPPAFGYGKKGLKGKVPPDAYLWYDIELINVED